MLGIGRAVAAVVGEVVALGLTAGIGYREVSLVTILVEGDTGLGVHEVVLLVDVEHLVLVGAVSLLVELVVLAIGLVAYVAVLHIAKDIPSLIEVQRSLDEG